MLACPDANVLRSFLCGELPDGELNDVASHVETCEHCHGTLPTLNIRGGLVDAVRELKGVDLHEADDPRLDALISGICQLLNSDGTAIAFDTGKTTPAPNPAGEVTAPAIPGYEILAELDHGGMGIVYKARHVHLGKIMALKVLAARSPMSASSVNRFREEMLALGKLDHAHIVQAHDAGVVDGVPYLAMEFLEGTDLGKLVEKRGPLPVADACDFIYQAALALHHAHEHGLVHRDLKPSNLFVRNDGVVKLLDLGLARFRGDPEMGPSAAPTRYDLLGTPGYMAPEQWQSAHEVDARADLYSLGCTLYHLLAGRPPFTGAIAEQRAGHLAATPTPLRQVRPDVPAALSNLVDRLLAKEPAERPASAAAVAAALQPFTVKPPRRRPPWRRPGVLAAALVSAAIITAGVIYVKTDRGTVEIRSDDPDIEVAVKQNGKLIVILDQKSKKEFSLRSGAYELELQGGKEGLTLSTDRFVLKRGDRKTVEVIPAPIEWVSKAPLLYATSSALVGVIDGKIYVVGGRSGGVSLPSLQFYDPGADKWENKTPMGEFGRDTGSAVVVNDKLHVLGGWRQAPVRQSLPTNTHFVYDPVKDREGGSNRSAWSEIEPLPLLSGAAVAGVIDGKIYLLTEEDGYAGARMHFHEYDLMSHSWTRLAAPPNHHTGGAGGVIDGKFYVVGGHQGTTKLAYVDMYDPAIKKWVARKAMTAPRTSLGAAVIAGKLYVAGGTSTEGPPLDIVEAYDPVKDTWTRLPPLRTPRCGPPALAAVGETLYVIGGSDNQGVIGSVEALDLRKLSRQER